MGGWVCLCGCEGVGGWVGVLVWVCGCACACAILRMCVCVSTSIPLSAGFTGIDAVYEPPDNPDLVLKAGEDTVDACVHSVLKLLQQHVRVM